jgi:hypothetical protein
VIVRTLRSITILATSEIPDAIYNAIYTIDKLLLRNTTKSSRTKNPISKTLNKIWGHGYCVIGAVTFQSCAYVARYVTKKIYGLAAPEHYGDREPEFCRSSNRPGIGASWFIKYADEVARNGFVLINGHKNPVPRYYLKRLERLDPQKLIDFQERKRIIMCRKQDNPDKSDERLKDREALQEYRAKSLRRDKATH